MIKFNYKDCTEYKSINELIDANDVRNPEKPAFIYKRNKQNITITYTHLKHDVLKLMSAISENFDSSVHIACIGRNSYQWILTYLSTLCLDNVFVPIDKDLPIEDLSRVVNSSDTSVIFCSKKHEKLFKENIELFSQIKYFICFEREENDDKFLSFEKFLNSAKQIRKTLLQKKSVNELKVLMYTSGTTGLAKGVMLSEHNILSCVYHGQRIDRLYGSYISVLPYHHAYESVCGLLVGLSIGATIIINDNLKRFVADLAEFKPEYLILVPAFTEMFYNKIMKNLKEKNMLSAFNKMIKLSNFLLKFHIDIRKKLFHSIHDIFGGNLIKVTSGGAPIRAEVGDFFENIGICIANGYGITECSPLISVNREDINDLRTVGFLIPCLKFKLENYINDREGEICVKGDTVMLGYYKDKEKTDEVLKDGWFYTGDYGYQNELGQIVITGRKKNLIVLKNGKNVYPEEIENYIMGIDEVLEVVVSSPKNEHGEEDVLCAEVYLDPETPLSLEELKAKIYGILKPLPIYKQVREIVIRKDEFPKTTSKKIKRN